MRNMAFFRRLIIASLMWYLFLQIVEIDSQCHGMNCRVYMIGLMENEIGSQAAEAKLSIYIVNTNENTTCVYYQTKRSQVSNISLSGKTTGVITFPSNYMVTTTNKGIRVEAEDGVIIYGENRFKRHNKHSMGGFLSIPVTNTDTDFYAVTLGKKTSQILLVGLYNNTFVNVTVRTNKNNCVQYEGNPYNDGKMIHARLDEYGTLQLQCPQGNLTGTLIQSSHPISVFSGSKRQTFSQHHRNMGHLVEQVPAVNSWGKHFVNIPPVDGEYICTIVAAEYNTTINFTCSDNASMSILLSKTRYYQTDLKTTICMVEANSPILVTLFIGTSNSDTSMVLVPPVRELSNDTLYFYVPRNLRSWLVFVSDVNIVNIDGTPYKNLTAVDNIPNLFSGTREIKSGIHSISTRQAPIRITGYIHGIGIGNKRAMSYPLFQHRQASHDYVTAKFHHGPCDQSAYMTTMPEATSVCDDYSTTSPYLTSTTSPKTSTTSERTSQSVNGSTSQESRLTTSLKTTRTSEWTSQSFDGSTSPPEITSTETILISNRTCSCFQYNCTLIPGSEEMKEIIKALRTELLISRKNTNKYMRSVTSVWDGRTSAKVLGYGTSIILISMVIGILILDLNNLIAMAGQIRRNLLPRPRPNTRVCG